MSDNWWESANCATTDPNLFTLDKGDSSAPAKKICAKCDVRVQCLQYAQETGQRGGIWGGLGDRERQALRRAAA